VIDMPFEGVLAREGLRPRLRRQATLTISVAVHAALVVVGIAYSLWHVEELSPPPMTVTLHLGALPPPPPPPPPLKKRSSTKPTTKTREKADLLVQPKEPSKEERPKEEADEDEGQDEGVAGGVAGGVTGGVVGGVIGGAAPPPPPKETGPKELLQLPRDLLLIDPNDDEYRVKLPRGLDRSGMKFTARLRICVSAQGAVTEVRVLKGADPAIDPQFPSVLGRWRYRPFTVDGRAVPFCYPIQYEVSAR
jgi:protein TonB